MNSFFPSQTQRYAKLQAQEIKKSQVNPVIALAHIVRPYGYYHTLQSGLGLRYPHEIAKNSFAECVESAAALYVIANELELNPSLLLGTGIESFGYASGHVLVAIDNEEKRVLCDPVMGLFGEYIQEDNEITTTLDPQTKRNIAFEKLEEITEQEFVEYFEFLRSQKGIESLLESGQTLVSNRPYSLWIKKEQNTITLEKRIEPPFSLNRAYRIVREFDENGPGEGWIEGGIYSRTQWSSLVDYKAVFSTQRTKKDSVAEVMQMLPGGENYLGHDDIDYAPITDFTERELLELACYPTKRIQHSWRRLKKWRLEPIREEIEELEQKRELSVTQSQTLQAKREIMHFCQLNKKGVHVWLDKAKTRSKAKNIPEFVEKRLQKIIGEEAEILPPLFGAYFAMELEDLAEFEDKTIGKAIQSLKTA